MPQLCSKGRYSRGRDVQLSDDNFRKRTGGNQYFNTCNIYRGKPSYFRQQQAYLDFVLHVNRLESHDILFMVLILMIPL